MRVIVFWKKNIRKTSYFAVVILINPLFIRVYVILNACYCFWKKNNRKK